MDIGHVRALERALRRLGCIGKIEIHQGDFENVDVHKMVETKQNLPRAFPASEVAAKKFLGLLYSITELAPHALKTI